MHSIAEAFWTQQQSDKQLPGRIGYRVVKVNQHAKSRIDRIVFGYRGPDEATVSLLNFQGARWSQAPGLFFDGDCGAVAQGSKDPQLELLQLFLRTGRDTV